MKPDELRHSCAHLMAAAVLKLYPSAKPTIGPVIENGFYYDFDNLTISDSDFSKIEKEMKNLVKSWTSFEKIEVTASEAKKIFKDNPYKLELISELEKKGEKITLYESGKFLDLCRGGHIKNPKDIKYFKLLSIAGAYWKGLEKNKMLTRIYGTVFATQEELDKYVWQQEEALKRDHRKIGAQLGLWTFSEYVGSGLPLFTQKGAIIRRLLCEYIESLQSKQGILQVWTPQFAKVDLFKISGHYDKYRENMFKVTSNYSDEEFLLKPMNCPQHTQIFASKQRSYKDLPIGMADFAMLYRDEKPGELSGLFRTRSFSQDDLHIFCREDQIIEEMNKALDMTKEIMETFGFKYKYRLSTRDLEHPEKYLGDSKTWDKAERLSEDILKKRKIDYFDGPGEAAFYAPKLDLIAIDSLGREWQLSTLQIDYVMPERFNLTYVDNDGKEKRPIMLHRAILGSPERMMAILIEHFSGNFPTWLTPVQVKVLPITEKHLDYAKKVGDKLKEEGIRVEVDERNERLQAKIRGAQLEKVAYMLIVGDREEKEGTVSERGRSGKDYGAHPLEKFINDIKEEIDKKTIN